MKILVFCPTYSKPDGEPAIYPDSLASLEALEHGGHEVTTWISIDPAEDKKGNVVIQYQRAEARVKDERFDAVLFFEHDMIVPQDALVKLVEANAPVAYGVYLFRHIKPTLNTYRAVSSMYVDQSLQLFPDELAQSVKLVIAPVSGMGFGCTLVRREVFERVRIRRPDDGNFPDGPFANDCQRLGIKQVARFDVLCGHIRPDGYVLWPFANGGYVADARKCKILTTFNGNVNGISIHFAEGEERMLPLESAVDFQRAGFLSIIENPPDAVKILNKPGRKAGKAVKV